MNKNISKRKTAEFMGRIAEYAAGIALMAKGYRLLSHRYRTPLGEIDLIAKKGNVIVFVEVKYRKTVETGLTALTKFQMNRQRKAIDWWLAKNDLEKPFDIRFDVIVQSPWKLPFHLRNYYDLMAR